MYFAGLTLEIYSNSFRFPMKSQDNSHDYLFHLKLRSDLHMHKTETGWSTTTVTKLTFVYPWPERLLTNSMTLDTENI